VGGAQGHTLAAQTVQGQLLDRETLQPVEGALAVLLEEDGTEQDGYLTNTSGRFILRAPRPGVYRVRTDRIGYETTTSELFELAEDQLFGLRLETGETAIELEELRVEGEQKCVVRPEEGMDLARVWEEARKALTVQEWTDREGLFRFQVVNYVRDLDTGARVVESETRRVTTGVSRSPIRSRPVDELMEKGFVQRLDDGGLEYWGPDAAVLLSDQFLDTHCFQLTVGPDMPESVGLSFEPVRGSDHPDIKGTLWLDRSTAALQFLEYGYTWAAYPEAQGVARGRVEFEEVPGGAWIVRRWWIRMPELAQDLTMAGGGRTGVFVAGIREAGGEVAQISTLDRRQIAQTQRGFVSGQVWDSTRSEPLEGARVFLSGTSYSAVTNSDGQFLLQEIPEGVFTAAFTHPRLDTLGVFAPGVDVEVVPGEIRDVALGVPSTGTILMAACREQERPWGGAVVSGVVLDSLTGEPIPRADVRIEWQEVTPAGGGKVSGTDRWIELTTDGEGRFTFCGAPGEELLTLRATFLEQEGNPVQLRVDTDSYNSVELKIELPAGFLRTGSGARGGIQSSSGLQGVQGYLLEPESGEPVRGAEVSVRQNPGPVRVSGTTNDRGFFRLQTGLPGTYELSARALGYSEIENQAVEVPPGKITVLEIRMVPEALEMEPLVVTAEARTFHLEMEGFYERQTRGLDTGIFFDPETIETRMPGQVTDLFFGLLGTRVVETVVGSRAVYFRGGERPLAGEGDGICWPMVYMDRQLIRSGGLGGDPADLDAILTAFDVSAVEVYRTPAEIPPTFNGPNAGCGVIVLWTRRGGSGGPSSLADTAS